MVYGVPEKPEFRAPPHHVGLASENCIRMSLASGKSRSNDVIAELFEEFNTHHFRRDTRTLPEPPESLDP